MERTERLKLAAAKSDQVLALNSQLYGIQRGDPGFKDLPVSWRAAYGFLFAARNANARTQHLLAAFGSAKALDRLDSAKRALEGDVELYKVASEAIRDARLRAAQSTS